MDERTSFNRREDIHIFTTVTNNPFFKQNRHIIKELFIKSIKAKHKKYSLFEIQFELLGHIIACEKIRKKYLKRKEWYAKTLVSLVEGKADIERIKIAQQHIKDMNEYSTTAKWIIFCLRSIGDGIAWWFFDYDRPTLRLLSEHDYIPVQKLGVGLLKEIEEYIKQIEQGNIVLINSITNFLRVGDLTLYNLEEKKYKLIEVKSTIHNNQKIQRQTKHRNRIEKWFNTEIHDVFGPAMKKISVNKPLLTHLKTLETVMIEADKNLGSSCVYGDYIAFGVFSLTKLNKIDEVESERKRTEIINRICSVVKKGDIALPVMTNIAASLHFSRGNAPYSIFPLDLEKRFRLMIGEYLIMIILNISGFKRWMNKRGWKTTFVNLPNEIPTESVPYIPMLQITQGIRTVELGLDMFTLASMELWMPESLELEVNGIIKATKNMTKQISSAFYTCTYPNIGKYTWD